MTVTGRFCEEREKNNYIIMLTRSMMKGLGIPKQIDEKGIHQHIKSITAWVGKLSPQQKGLIVSKGLKHGGSDHTTNPPRTTSPYVLTDEPLPGFKDHSGEEILNRLALLVILSVIADLAES